MILDYFKNEEYDTVIDLCLKEIENGYGKNLYIIDGEYFYYLWAIYSMRGNDALANQYLELLESVHHHTKYGWIADAYFEGKYVKQDYLKAIYYAEKGNKEEDLLSDSLLVKIYKEGLGVEINLKLAEEYEKDLEYHIELREYRR